MRLVCLLLLFLVWLCDFLSDCCADSERDFPVILPDDAQRKQRDTHTDRDIGTDRDKVKDTQIPTDKDKAKDPANYADGGLDDNTQTPPQKETQRETQREIRTETEINIEIHDGLANANAHTSIDSSATTSGASHGFFNYRRAMKLPSSRVSILVCSFCCLC